MCIGCNGRRIGNVNFQTMKSKVIIHQIIEMQNVNMSFLKTYTLYETPQVHIFYRSGGKISIMLEELDTQMCLGYIAKGRKHTSSMQP